MCRSRAFLAFVAASFAFSIAGCGKDAAAPRLSAEQRAVAEVNEVCAEYTAFARAWAAQVGERPSRPAVERLRTVKSAAAARTRTLLRPVAAEPRVRRYLDAVAARERLRSQLATLAAGRKSNSTRLAPDPLGRLYAATLRAYEDARALGLGSCTGPPPRKPIGG
jgi:hypothetical protein